MLIRDSLVVGASTARSRFRRSAAKRGFGAIGMIGARNASNGSIRGSGISAPFVDKAELPSSPNKQGFGGSHAAIHYRGRLGHAEPVQVAQGQGGPVLWGEVGEHFVSPPAIHLDIPGIVWVG